jgi:lambda repressor-like predicted transcriptional regulator
VSGVRLVAHCHKAGEDIVARCAAQEPNVCDGERHCGLESSMVPYENDLIAKVNGVSASVIVELLAVVLRRQKADWARRDIIGVVHLQGLLLARIIED